MYTLLFKFPLYLDDLPDSRYDIRLRFVLLDEIKAISATPPILQHFADAGRCRLPWLLHITDDDILDITILS